MNVVFSRNVRLPRISFFKPMRQMQFTRDIFSILIKNWDPITGFLPLQTWSWELGLRLGKNGRRDPCGREGESHG